ncbi:MAG: hypothetical protein M3Q81_02105 [bacterium]|nr:hypothetical protein [bacterium]
MFLHRLYDFLSGAVFFAAVAGVITVLNIVELTVQSLYVVAALYVALALVATVITRRLPVYTLGMAVLAAVLAELGHAQVITATSTVMLLVAGAGALVLLVINRLRLQ